MAGSVRQAIQNSLWPYLSIVQVTAQASSPNIASWDMLVFIRNALFIIKEVGCWSFAMSLQTYLWQTYSHRRSCGPSAPLDGRSSNRPWTLYSTDTTRFSMLGHYGRAGCRLVPHHTRRCWSRCTITETIGNIGAAPGTCEAVAANDLLTKILQGSCCTVWSQNCWWSSVSAKNIV